MSKNKKFIKVAVDHKNKVVELSTAIDVDSQDAYIEIIETLVEQVGLKVYTYAWHFDDIDFVDLEAMAEFFNKSNEKENDKLMDELIKEIKNLDNPIKTTLNTVHHMLQKLVQLIEVCLKYESEGPDNGGN